MQKLILTGLLATFSLTTSLCFAGEKSFDVKYTPEQFKKEPAFSCTTDAVSILPLATVTIVANSELQLIGAEKKGTSDMIEGLSTNDLDRYYFQAAQAPKNDAHVTVTVSGKNVSQQTHLSCDFVRKGELYTK